MDLLLSFDHGAWRAPAPGGQGGELGLVHRRTARSQEDDIVRHEAEHLLLVAGARCLVPIRYQAPDLRFIV